MGAGVESWGAGLGKGQGKEGETPGPVTNSSREVNQR